MNLVEDLFAFIGPRPVAVQEMGRSRVLLLSAFAVLSALVARYARPMRGRLWA